MICAIVLAAGLSTRMGTPKMLLPWGDTTVIGKVVSTLLQSGIQEIRVITGGNHAKLKALLDEYCIQLLFNKDYANGEMLTSIQVGLIDLSDRIDAVLIVLGDQPQIEVSIVKELVKLYCISKHPIIVPSYKMHRGHPWIVDRTCWQEIIGLRPPQTLHEFLNLHNDIIDYVIVDSSSVIQDLDTFEEYSQFKP